jgi:hypothetical protein
MNADSGDSKGSKDDASDHGSVVPPQSRANLEDFDDTSGQRTLSSSMRMGCCADLGLDSVSPSSQSMSIGIGFSGDPSPDDVVGLRPPNLDVG